MTQKRLESLSPTQRLKFVAGWLETLWPQLPETNFAQRQQMAQELNLVLGWLEWPKPWWPVEELEKFCEALADLHWQIQMQRGLRADESPLLPRLRQGDRSSSEPWQPALDYWVATDQVRSGFNLGSMLRSIDCFGLAGLISWGVSAPPHSREIAKTAMGTETWIPHQRVESLPQTLTMLKAQGYPILALEPSPQAHNALTWTWPRRAVLLFGNEEYGISQECLQLADTLVEIPMQGRKNSLNVAATLAAIGVLLQRGVPC